MTPYGKELILDLHDCDPVTFTRDSIARYFAELCDLIGMEACDLHFWDDEGMSKEDCQTDPKTKGISAIQFIITSNITLHSLELLKTVHVNLFSCKEFDAAVAAEFTVTWFDGTIAQEIEVSRL